MVIIFLTTYFLSGSNNTVVEAVVLLFNRCVLYSGIFYVGGEGKDRLHRSKLNYLGLAQLLFVFLSYLLWLSFFLYRSLFISYHVIVKLHCRMLCKVFWLDFVYCIVLCLEGVPFYPDCYAPTVRLRRIQVKLVGRICTWNCCWGKSTGGKGYWPCWSLVTIISWILFDRIMQQRCASLLDSINWKEKVKNLI